MTAFNNFRANPKDIPSSESVAMLDLDYFYELTVISNGENHTVIDHENKRMYAVECINAEAAVRAYLDWVFGEMPLYTYDKEIDDWEQTERAEWASAYFDIIEEHYTNWEQIEER